MCTVLGHLHGKVFLLILSSQCHLKMGIYCLGVKITINGREEVLAFEILLYAYLRSVNDRTNSQRIRYKYLSFVLHDDQNFKTVNCCVSSEMGKIANLDKQ